MKKNSSCEKCVFYGFHADDGPVNLICELGKPVGITDCSNYVGVTPIKSKPEKNDMVNHPSHYNRNGLECMSVIRATLGDEKYEGFLTGNIIKYIFRYPDKNGIEDCKKARFYLNELIELLDK